MRIRGRPSPNFLDLLDDKEELEIKILSINLLAPHDDIKTRGDLQIVDSYKHLVIHPYAFDELSSNSLDDQNPEKASEGGSEGELGTENEITSSKSNQMDLNFSMVADDRKPATISSSSSCKVIRHDVYENEEIVSNKRLSIETSLDGREERGVNTTEIFFLSCSTDQIEDSRIHLKQKCEATRMKRSPLLQLGQGTVTFVQVDLTCFCSDSTEGTGGLSCFCSDSAGSFNSFNILSLSCSTDQKEDSRIHLKYKCEATRMKRSPLLQIEVLYITLLLSYEEIVLKGMDLVIHQEDFEDLSSNNISQMKGLSKDGSEGEEITNDASNTPKLDETSSSSFGKEVFYIRRDSSDKETKTLLLLVAQTTNMEDEDTTNMHEQEECTAAPKNDSLQEHEIINEMVSEVTVVEAKERRVSGRERKFNIAHLQRKRKSKCQKGAFQNRWKMKRENQKG
ncbi:hypothetical protein ACOSP7_017360 [Xanthoceras sorbifolium]